MLEDTIKDISDTGGSSLSNEKDHRDFLNIGCSCVLVSSLMADKANSNSIQLIPTANAFCNPDQVLGQSG